MLNEFYQNIGLKGFIKRYGIANSLERGLYSIFPIHFVKDYEVKKLLWQRRVAHKLEKYMRYESSAPTDLTFPNSNLKDVVWIYWDKGIETAPDIIKACYKSIIKYSTQPIVLLTASNVHNYIQMPRYILEKKEKGSITVAHYTDLLRFALLEHYGGTWIDATVLLTKKIPDEILNSDFFALQNTIGLIQNPVLYPVWFIHARKGNELIKKTRNVEFAFWKHENHVKEYLISNLIMTRIIHNNVEKEKNIPYMASDSSEYLVKILGEQYSDCKWIWINSLTGIHKLTYKLSPAIDQPNSFYRWILDH